MSNAVVTLKITPTDFHLIEQCLQYRLDMANKNANNKAEDGPFRHNERGVAMQVSNLLRNLS